MSNKILNKNLYKMIYNNFMIKSVPEVNMFKVQKYINSNQKNNYNLDYSYYEIKKLFEKKEGFIYMPSELFLKEFDSNHWMYNKRKNIVWRPNIYIQDSIEIKMFNNSIYMDEINIHPDIIQPVIMDDDYDKKYELIDISLDDLINKKLN